MDFVSVARRHRSNLRRNRRAVSPIIATILLVAITVALAATLYILLIPLIPPTTSQLEGNLAWGAATPKTGTPGNLGCATHDYCWQVSIASAPDGVAPSSLLLYVQNASGLTISNATWTFSFVTSNNVRVAYAPGPTAGSSGPGWTGNGTSSVLTLSMYLWVDTGAATGFTGQTVTLQTVGTNGFTGHLKSLTLPS